MFEIISKVMKLYMVTVLSQYNLIPIFKFILFDDMLLLYTSRVPARCGSGYPVTKTKKHTSTHNQN